MNKDCSVCFHKFINTIMDARHMRCGDSLGHMGRPSVKHKKHRDEIKGKLTKTLVDPPKRVHRNGLIDHSLLDAKPGGV